MKWRVNYYVSYSNKYHNSVIGCDLFVSNENQLIDKNQGVYYKGTMISSGMT